MKAEKPEGMIQLCHEVGLHTDRLEKLEKQMRCGVAGHKMTFVRRLYGNSEIPDDLTFQCIKCEARYNKQHTRLTEHEKALVAAVES